MESEGHAAARQAAASIRAVRGRRDMSQAAVAAGMRDCGWPWHQTTVGRVESGAQPLSYGEVIDLAAILGVTPERLAAAGPEEAELSAATAAADRLRAAWDEASAAARRLGEARTAAEKAVPAARASRYPAVREIAAAIEADLAALGQEPGGT